MSEAAEVPKLSIAEATAETTAIERRQIFARSSNIDLNRRPSVKNADGSGSTVRSITIVTPDGKAVLIPTVVGNRVVSNEEAIKHFQQTGENLGIFKDEASADRYAHSFHEQQAQVHSPKRR